MRGRGWHACVLRIMKQLLCVITLTGPVLFSVIPASAAPANDNFGNAIPLSGLIVTTTGSNVGASKEPSEPNHGGSSGGASVWWTWTAPDNGLTTIDTFGSSFDTLLGVYVGTTVNQLTTIAGNDDYSSEVSFSTQSLVTFAAVAGTVYHIAVDGFFTSRGSITLHIRGPNGVSISSPTNGAVFTLGDPIPFTASIGTNFPNPPAVRVDFYRGGVRFDSSTNAPFTAAATNSPLGTNRFYIVAFDNSSQSYTSATVNVFVQNVGVTLLLPLEGSYLDFGGTNPIPVTAWAYLPSGSITNIEFFVDGQKFGEDATAPFSAVWRTVSGGSHRLTAIGESDTGASYRSQPVNIAVYRDLVSFGSIWKYLDDGSNQGTNWVSPAFDDSAWASGPSPLGYGDSNGRLPATTNSFGPDANNRYITTYYRKEFVVTNVTGYLGFYILFQRDDGAVVYVNGAEVGRNNMPSGTIAYTTLASGSAFDDGGNTYFFFPDDALFREGTNVVAVEVHQNAANSTDLWFQLELIGIPTIIRNLAPLVAITSPTNNFHALAPSQITLEADASDPDGNVAKVEFFADGVKLGQTTNAPYRIDWNSPPLGPHSLTAIATDDQGAIQQAAAVDIVVYDSLGTPLVQITGPKDGAAIEGGTNLLITAYASAPSGVTNVQFLANDSAIGDDSASPFSVIWDAPFGDNLLRAVVSDANGLAVTSAVVRLTVFPNTTAPRIASQFPLAGSTLSNFTALLVLFSERVQHVDAGDLLVSGIPATGVTGSGSNYVFSFPQPPYGEVEIAWSNGHGITDFGFPSDLPFNELSPDAQWEYQLIDRTAPTIAARTPAPGATVTNVAQISVTFSEPVTGVDAADLLVNGAPALDLAGSGTNYTFEVAPPAPGTVNITWATNHGIFDRAESPNAFIGSSANAIWSFTVDPRVVLVQSNATWNFLKGFAEASIPMDAWRQPGFDDSGWSNSPAPFFYGDPYTDPAAGIFGTLLSDMQGNYSTVFLRKTFTVGNVGAITNLLINHQSDDGFIAWLNGVEILRYNVPAGELPYNALASTAAFEPNFIGAAYIVAALGSNAVSRLVNGTNLLAVQGFNASLTLSSDFGFNAQLYYFPVDASTVAPRLGSVDPAPGDVFYLTNVTIHFSEGVSEVDAADLLVNGIPATEVSSTTNVTYTFSFPQPPYGPVLLTWATNHGIADLDNPPKPFDGAATSSVLGYTLLNPTSPRILSQDPPASTTVTGLTSITVTFTKPVTGVEAPDLLVSGTPAETVSSADSTEFTFTFPQPPFGVVAIRWATNHGILDLQEPPASFDPTRFGGQWNYTLIDPVPSVTLTSPTNNTFLLAPATVTLGATASDNDGTVELVEFYEGTNKLGEGTNAPYSLTVSNLPLGVYLLRAVASDNIGLRGTSAPVVLNVVTSLPIFLVRGPYLQIGSPTGGVVRWRTDLISDAVVFHGTDPANLTNIAAQTTVTTEHIVPIGGLQPDTKYYYSIGSSGQRLAGTNGAHSDFWFKTSPPPGTGKPTRFWVLGDCGTANDNARNVRDAYYNFAATNRPADFWLMLGDNAYNSGLDTEYQRAVFEMYPDTLRNLFLWPTIGNHESGQWFSSEDFPYLHIFSLPHEGEAGGVPSGTQKYYSFDYANIHFTCLDSMTSGRTTNTAMVQWLENDLAATAQQWIVVFFHHPPYTRGNHNSDFETELIEIRQNILPVLEAYGVDLVLCGHSHNLERSFLLHGHYDFSTTFSDSMKIDGGDGREDGTGAYRKNELGQGVVYSVSGSSGQITGGSLDHPAHFLSLNELGSLVVDVNGGRLDVKFLGTNGLSFDHYTLLKEPRPVAPINLIARALDANDITLTWTDVATNALGYIIERSIDGTDFGRFATNAVDTTNALDRGLLDHHTYFYRVRAFNAGGESGPSGVASVSTVTAAAAPQSPDGLVVRAGNAAEAYRNQIILRWRDRSTDEAGFLIERSDDGDTFSPLATVGANATLFVDRDLASATAYYYRVRSFNPVGDSAPSNLESDQTNPRSILAFAGESAVFNAGVEGTPPIRYQWRFMDIAIDGETNQTLTIPNVQFSGEGAYTVVITDATGSTASNPAWLFVLAPPSILGQPASRTNVVGSSATLQVVADGTSPLLYQWRQNGSPLFAAGGPELMIGPVTRANQGDYDVVVRNEFGAVTSLVARLVVNTPPVVGADLVYDFHGENLTVNAAALLANDFDMDGDAISLSAVSTNSSRGGTVTWNGGSIFYSPPADFLGDDTFTYVLTDARGADATGLVTVSLINNRAPALAPMANYVVDVLKTLVVTNTATDRDPADKLTLFLEAGAPTNARINSTTGVLHWTPTRQQAPSTNLFTVRVDDDGTPSLSDRKSFTVTVNDYLEVSAGTAMLNAGESNSVPLDIFSSSPVVDLQYLLRFPAERLFDLVVEQLVPQWATVSLQMSGSNTAALAFNALPDHSFQGTQHLARLHFTTVAGQTSAFVPLSISSLSCTRATAGFAPALLANDGRLVVIGAEPLLEPLLGSNGRRQLILYGKKGVTYSIQSRTSLGPEGSWLIRASVPLPSTNFFRILPAPSPTAPLIFYRAAP